MFPRYSAIVVCALAFVNACGEPDLGPDLGPGASITVRTFQLPLRTTPWGGVAHTAPSSAVQGSVPWLAYRDARETWLVVEGSEGIYELTVFGPSYELAALCGQVLHFETVSFHRFGRATTRADILCPTGEDGPVVESTVTHADTYGTGISMSWQMFNVGGATPTHSGSPEYSLTSYFRPGSPIEVVVLLRTHGRIDPAPIEMLRRTSEFTSPQSIVLTGFGPEGSVLEPRITPDVPELSRGFRSVNGVWVPLHLPLRFPWSDTDSVEGERLEFALPESERRPGDVYYKALWFPHNRTGNAEGSQSVLFHQEEASAGLPELSPHLSLTDPFHVSSHDPERPIEWVGFFGSREVAEGRIIRLVGSMAGDMPGNLDLSSLGSLPLDGFEMPSNPSFTAFGSDDIDSTFLYRMLEGFDQPLHELDEQGYWSVGAVQRIR